jgi:hypothetical protein
VSVKRRRQQERRAKRAPDRRRCKLCDVALSVSRSAPLCMKCTVSDEGGHWYATWYERNKLR